MRDSFAPSHSTLLLRTNSASIVTQELMHAVRNPNATYCRIYDSGKTLIKKPGYHSPYFYHWTHLSELFWSRSAKLATTVIQHVQHFVGHGHRSTVRLFYGYNSRLLADTIPYSKQEHSYLSPLGIRLQVRRRVIS
jgi:hypothetical protein